MGTAPSDNPDGGTPPTRTFEATETSSGREVGPYHLLQMVGEGGMGEVWLAEQKEPVRRRVAVKLIKAGNGYAGGGRPLPV